MEYRSPVYAVRAVPIEKSFQIHTIRTRSPRRK